MATTKSRRISIAENGLAGMTTVEHLQELRKRLFVCMLALVVGSIIAFTFRDWLVAFLTQPLPATANYLARTTGNRLVVMGLTEGFTVYMLLSLFGGLILALPVVLFQFWGFIAPGLYAHERRNALPFILAGLFLFFCGLALSYVVLRYPVQWLVEVASDSFTTLITADSYFKFVAVFMLVFGLIFELPLVLTFIARVGIISRQTLEQKRAVIHFGMWVLSAFATPGADIYSPVILGAAMSGLYELSIIFIRFFVKERPDEDEEVSD